MRDDYSWSKTTQTTERRYFLGTLINQSQWDVTNHVWRSFRDDSVSTVPLGGVYYKPTLYRAFYSSARWGAFSSRFNFSASDYAIQEGTNYSFPFFSPLYYGCNNVFPYEPLVDSSVIQQGRAEINRKVRSELWDLSQSAGEAKLSGKLLGNLFVGFLKSFLAWKRGQGNLYWVKYSRMTIRDARRFGGLQARVYLTYMYGLRPLMEDAYQLAKLIQDGLAKPQIGRCYVNLPDPTYKLPTLFTNMKGSVTGSVKRGFKSEVYITLKSPELYQLDRYGITSPLALAWELTTLSFVVDWFLHIGSFLEALNPPWGVKFLDGYETVWLENAIHAEYDYNYRVPLRAPNVDLTTRSMKRVPLSSFPIPKPYLGGGVLSRSQLITIGQLMAAMYKA